MECRIKLFIAIFILGFLMVGSSFAENTGIPELPAQYYGKIISPTPLNGYIEAKIGDKNYSKIPLENGTFGGPTYLDKKLLVYAPGQNGIEVNFYLNGSIPLNTSEPIKYNPGDIRFVKLYYNIDIKKLEILKETIVLEDEEDVVKIVDINNASIHNKSELILVELPLVKIRDTLIIPVVVNETPKINSTVVEKLNKTLEIAKKIKKVEIKDETDVKEVVKDIVENITPVIAVNFKVTNETVEKSKKVGKKVVSTISFEAIPEDPSKKGSVTVVVPIGKLKVENVTVFNETAETATVALREWNGSDVGTKIGWYKIIGGEILEITLIKDPIVKITLSAELPSEKTTPEDGGGNGGYISRGVGPSPITEIVAKDIKSEKIRYFVYKAKLIVGSEIDVNLSARYLKTEIELIKTPMEIKENCILVGGPVANPIVKKYLNYFPVRVTNEYPGKHRGVIEVIKIDGHTVVLLAGSDRWGTKAAVEYFKTLEDLPEETISVEWRNGTAVRIEKP